MPDRAPVVVEIKSATVPPTYEVRWSWWATVDRHPYSDKRGYDSEEAALQAAGAWIATNYPDREFVIEGEQS